jgi:hypothetical protein
MERLSRLRPVLGPSLVVVLTAGMLGLVLVSLAVQPPYDAGADSTQRMLGWARAGLFTAGALAFAGGLALALRGGSPPAPVALRREPRPPKPLPAAFTLVALGRTSEDTRAIADTATAVDAIRLLWQWADTHPDEHIVVFNPDAEPIAFKRPLRARGLLRRGAA